MRQTVFVILATFAASPLLSRAADPVVPRPGPRTAVNIAWSDPDAQKKVADFLGSHQAHREAILSLGQCRSCHGGNAAGWTFDVAALAALQPQGPWIGISVGPADGVLRSQLRLPEGAGVVVTQVVPNGPAQQSGVEEDDVLLSVNGKPVASGEDLDKILQSASPDGPPLTLKLLHAGQSLEKQVTPRKAEAQSFIDSFLVQGHPTYRIGVSVTEPDQTLRRQLKLRDAGLVVSEVQPAKPAETAGVKAGDVLLSINGKRITKQAELTEEVLRAAETPVELELMRGGVTLKITVTPVKEQAAATPTDAYWTFVAQRPEQTRELMLVHPGGAHLLNSANLLTTQAAATQTTTQPQADQLKQITQQLDELRRSVEALRQDLEQQRKGEPEDAK